MISQAFEKILLDIYSFQADSERIRRKDRGLYYKSLCANDPDRETTDVLALYLTNGGTLIPGSGSLVSTKRSNVSVTLSGMTIANVTSPPANIVLEAGHTGGLYGEATMIIRKLD